MPSAIKDLGSPTPIPPKSGFHSPQALFQRLIQDIQAELGPNDGIVSSNSVRLRLESLVKDYRSEEEAWQDFAFEDTSQTFTRNLVDKGNGKYNLVRISWLRSLEQSIDVSTNSWYWFGARDGRILKGTLTETRYAWPKSTEPTPMQTTKCTNFGHDEVTYMADTLGLHKISNPDSKEFAVSLHLYTPPNAAIDGCQIFNANTGEATHVTVYNYYSEYGRRCIA
ncbi:MAG: hypothetical protein Q9188_007163 [Gyalolechia gomerana]